MSNSQGMLRHWEFVWTVRVKKPKLKTLQHIIIYADQKKVQLVSVKSPLRDVPECRTMSIKCLWDQEISILIAMNDIKRTARATLNHISLCESQFSHKKMLGQIQFQKQHANRQSNAPAVI